MSGDRFELELRELLRDEAKSAPVVLTLGEVRARAGSRSRVGRWFGTGRLALGVAALAIAALALLVSLNPSKPLPAVGGSPATPAGTAPAAVATPLASALRPVFSPLPISLGSAGTAIVVGAGADAVDVYGVHSGGAMTPITHIVDLAARLGGWRLADSGDGRLRGAISSNGVLALTVTRGDGDQPETATAVLPLFGTGSFPIVPATGGLAFERDGTLVIAGSSAVTSSPPPYDGREMLAMPAAVTVATTPDGRPSLVADGSGVYGAQETSGPGGVVLPFRTEVIVAWDGSLRAADPSVDPLLVTGSDRAFGANGQTAFPWNDGSGAGGTSSSGLAVEGPTTKRVETGLSDVRAFAWSPDGRTLYLVTETSLWTFDGKTKQKVAILGATTAASRVVGFTPSAILLEAPNGLTFGVGLDGGGEDGLGGALVGVVG